MTRPVVPFGDSAWLVEVDDVEQAHGLAWSVGQAVTAGAAPAGIGDVVVGFRSLVVHVDPLDGDGESCQSWLAGLDADPSLESAAPDRPASSRRVDIPTVFNGPDLRAVAAAAGISTETVIDLLTGSELRVAFLGFSPGFSYLVGLPPELERIQRRATPRTAVPPGSVALAGGFAAIYPRATPGGWMLVGHTSLPMFDPDVPPYARLRAGDTVCFRRAEDLTGTGAERVGGHRDPVSDPTTRRPPQRARSSRFAEVLEPGILSLVEDEGRSSVAAIGIPDAGPADPDAMWLANRLVGNPDGAGTIELTARGPTIRFRGDAHVGVVAATTDGVDVEVDGHRVGADSVVPVRSGQIMSIGQLRHGLRAYIGIAGGIDIPPVVGSRSSDVLSGLGLGPLVVGDQLDLGTPGHPRGLLAPSPSYLLSSDPTTVRVVEGPHRFSRTDLESLCSGGWRVEVASNRVGLRLSGPDSSTPAPPASWGRIESTGTVTGAIQVPPDGRPIVLMPDHATVGGYPVIACVISADLAQLGQLRGGDNLYFELVTHQSARASLIEHRRQLAGRVTGWFPAEAGT